MKPVKSGGVGSLKVPLLGAAMLGVCPDALNPAQGTMDNQARTLGEGWAPRSNLLQASCPLELFCFPLFSLYFAQEGGSGSQRSCSQDWPPPTPPPPPAGSLWNVPTL